MMRQRMHEIVAGMASAVPPLDRSQVGTTFVSRLAEETGADIAHIARAYAVSVAVFGPRGFSREVQALDDVVDEQTQFKMLLQGRRLLTRAARWLVRNRRPPLDIGVAVSDYASGSPRCGRRCQNCSAALTATLGMRVTEFAGAGVLSTLASRVAALDALFFAFDIVEIVREREEPVRRAAGVHLALDRCLGLAWLRDRILELPRADLWQTLARAALRDDLYKTHRALTSAVLEASATSTDDDGTTDAWAQASAATVERYLGMLGDIRAAGGNDLTTLSVGVRALANLVPSTSH